jgi:hypothetical protein
MIDQTNSPIRGEKDSPPPSCVACANPMKFITLIADPLLKRVRLFECAECRTTAFTREP